jgi:hypothetical protein
MLSRASATKTQHQRQQQAQAAGLAAQVARATLWSTFLKTPR